MSVVRLSHSAKEKYIQSPIGYYLHYYLNLREKVAGSALFFGSIVESGLEVLLAGGTLEQAKETFIKNFKTQRINGQVEVLATSENVRFSKSDLDIGVFTESELKFLEDKSLQYRSWASLQRKGEMLLEAYQRDILPKIKKVVATQPEKVIVNEDGDEIIVKADLICEWEDGRLVIPDHKTTSSSPKQLVQNLSYLKQTALYFAAFGDEYPLDDTGFITLEKKIRKNEPRARVDFIFHKPTEEIIQTTIEEFDFVFENVKMGNFPLTIPTEGLYGQEWCYKRYLESNGKDLTGLVKIKKR